ncbi:hypothetical protein BDR05DRAFT_950962 [Suillus weaverae]|nr:hypothetical protein BDR05DRAFT_950962 [Suillus weaverae]
MVSYGGGDGLKQLGYLVMLVWVADKWRVYGCGLLVKTRTTSGMVWCLRWSSKPSLEVRTLQNFSSHCCTSWSMGIWHEPQKFKTPEVLCAFFQLQLKIVLQTLSAIEDTKISSSKSIVGSRPMVMSGVMQLKNKLHLQCHCDTSCLKSKSRHWKLAIEFLNIGIEEAMVRGCSWFKWSDSSLVSDHCQMNIKTFDTSRFVDNDGLGVGLIDKWGITGEHIATPGPSRKFVCGEFRGQVQVDWLPMMLQYQRFGSHHELLSNSNLPSHAYNATSLNLRMSHGGDCRHSSWPQVPTVFDAWFMTVTGPWLTSFKYAAPIFVVMISLKEEGDKFLQNFLNLVNKDDGIGFASEVFAELSSSIMTNIARNHSIRSVKKNSDLDLTGCKP